MEKQTYFYNSMIGVRFVCFPNVGFFWLSGWRGCRPFFVAKNKPNKNINRLNILNEYIMGNDFDKYKSKDNFKKYESLNDYLAEDKPNDLSNQKFDKVVTLKVTKETFEMWELLCENWGEVLGYENKSKIFEFAIVEALNVPISSLGGYNHEGWDID